MDDLADDPCNVVRELLRIDHRLNCALNRTGRIRFQQVLVQRHIDKGWVIEIDFFIAHVLPRDKGFVRVSDKFNLCRADGLYPFREPIFAQYYFSSATTVLDNLLANDSDVALIDCGPVKPSVA